MTGPATCASFKTSSIGMLRWGALSLPARRTRAAGRPGRTVLPFRGIEVSGWQWPIMKNISFGPPWRQAVGEGERLPVRLASTAAPCTRSFGSMGSIDPIMTPKVLFRIYYILFQHVVFFFVRFSGSIGPMMQGSSAPHPFAQYFRHSQFFGNIRFYP